MQLTRRQHFRIARTLLGVYLAVHFAMLSPYAVELFSSQGMLPVARQSPLALAFPNLLSVCDAPWMASSLVVLGLLSGCVIAHGTGSRIAALLAYYVWACLFGRNPLIANPSLPYVGLMLLVVTCVDEEKLERQRPEGTRHTRLLWIAMAMGYSYSGLTKLHSPSWADGEALFYVLESPLARPSVLRDFVVSLPSALLHAASFAALALEVCFLPLALSSRARPWLWGAMLSLHLALIALVQFADLSLAMVLLHVFTFDPTWFERGPDVTAFRAAARAGS